MALIWKRAVVCSRVPMSKYIGWYSLMALRNTSNALAGWKVWLTATCAGAGPESGETPAAVTAAGGRGCPVRASVTGTSAGVLASVSCSRPVASSASMVDSPSIDTACRPRACTGTTASQLMRAKLLTGMFSAASPAGRCARLRMVWSSAPRHCNTSCCGAFHAALAEPSLKNTASRRTVSPGAAAGRSSR
ncbi:Uncharacterised protein [Bordetella pertussis]|nr:Uncharacterised protein [Bordetella pertussis]CFN91725.1 Uncharacterised protein [Bordetella pertussis]CPJ81176.1 Uncharacterised protein [Bordetella pertussis]CPJ97553.1 Uncharacterised protein [Bordetella pertussis]CPN28235.1 Uncharacterised protein [Bordetella pertussis]